MLITGGGSGIGGQLTRRFAEQGAKVAFLDIAEEHRLPLSVGLNFRYLPVHQKYKELLTAEFLGQVGFGEFWYRRHRDGRRPGINKYPLTMKQPMMLEQTIRTAVVLRTWSRNASICVERKC